MIKSILVIGLVVIKSFSFAQLNRGSNQEIETQENISDSTYNIEMKNNYQMELAERMKNWSPDRVKAFRRVFVYGPGRGFEPITKDTIYFYYPSLDKY